MDAAVKMALASGVTGSSVPTLARMLLDRVLPELRPRPVTAVKEGSAEIALDASPAGLLTRAGEVENAGPRPNRGHPDNQWGSGTRSS